MSFPSAFEAALLQEILTYAKARMLTIDGLHSAWSWPKASRPLHNVSTKDGSAAFAADHAALKKGWSIHCFIAVIQADRYRVISLAVLRAVRMTPMSVAEAGPVHSP